MEPDDICPECGDEEHQVLKESPNNITAKCDQCHHVWSWSPRRSRVIQVNTVVSSGDQSWNVSVPTPDNELISVGDEFELDGHRMLVTSVEIDGQQLPPSAKASDVRTLFAKVFDTVPLKLSVNEKDKTRSYRIDVDPDMEVPIGLVLDVQGVRLAIKTLKSDQNRTLHKGFLFARNIVRAFCDPAPAKAKPGSIIGTRPRGAPAEAKGAPPAKRIKGPRGQRSPKRS